jgi:hypothetical protein
VNPLLVVLASALFAGIVATAVTLAIEKWGGVVGGFLGTLPTTIVPAAIGVHLSLPSSDAFADAMFVAPAGMFLNAGFLFLWREVPPRMPDGSLRVRLIVMTAVSLVVWLLGAVTIVTVTGWIRQSQGSMSAFAVGTTLLLAAIGIVACLRPLHAPKGLRSVGSGTLAARGLLAGCSIAVSVSIAQNGGAFAAGIASVFPAIFLTTMISLWLSQGEAVPAGAVGPMMLGSTSVAAYAIFASQSLPALGPFFGSIVAWIAAASLVTLPASAWLSRRRRRQALA